MAGHWPPPIGCCSWEQHRTCTTSSLFCCAASFSQCDHRAPSFSPFPICVSALLMRLAARPRPTNSWIVSHSLHMLFQNKLFFPGFFHVLVGGIRIERIFRAFV